MTTTVNGGKLISDTDQPALITIIIATYNSSVTLRWSIESALRQRYENFEILIIGDACTDDSAEVVASFDDPRLQWINLTTNCGSQWGPNNEGLKRAKGKYVAYLGHDDLWFPWHLCGLVKAIESTDGSLAHALVALIGPEGIRGVSGAPATGHTYATHNVPPSGWLHRSDIVTHCGYWPDAATISFPVDIGYMAQISNAGLRIDICPEVSVIKFPSGWWRTYAKDSSRPQAAFSEMLKSDPDAAYKRVMRDIALRLSQEWHLHPPAKAVLANLLFWLRQWITVSHLFDKWPLSVYKFRRFHGYRNRLRVERGLPLEK